MMKSVNFSIITAVYNRVNVIEQAMRSVINQSYDNYEHIVDDVEYVGALELRKKGGYNLIDNFVRIYLTMTKNLLLSCKIKSSTYDKIENGIIRFCADWKNIVRFDSRYTFTFSDDRAIIENMCGKRGFVEYRIFVVISFFKQLLKRVFYLFK